MFHLLLWYAEKMADLKEQHICIKCCCECNVDSFQLLKVAAGHLPVAKTHVFKLFSKSKTVCTLLKEMNAQASIHEQKTDENVVKELVLAKRKNAYV
jgi:CxxC motif-containing protein